MNESGWISWTVKLVRCRGEHILANARNRGSCSVIIFHFSGKEIVRHWIPHCADKYCRNMLLSRSKVKLMMLQNLEFLLYFVCVKLLSKLQSIFITFVFDVSKITFLSVVNHPWCNFFTEFLLLFFIVCNCETWGVPEGLRRGKDGLVEDFVPYQGNRFDDFDWNIWKVLVVF